MNMSRARAIGKETAERDRSDRARDAALEAMRPDFWFHDHGSIVVLVPRSEGAQAWAGENLPADAPMWGYGYAIEPRYVQAVLDGIADEGLTVDLQR